MNKKELTEVNKRIKIDDYSFKEYSDYFKQFDSKKLCIEMTDGEEIIVLFKVSLLPHLIGLQYAYDKKSNRKYYKGEKGFNLLNNSEETFNSSIFKHRINANKEKIGGKIISWEDDILPRIEWLPCFLNNIEKQTTLKKNVESGKHPLVNTLISGNYFCFQNENKEYLIMSLLKTGKTYSPQTFIVNDGIRLLGVLPDIEIKKVYWID